jgi:DNA-binding CsgD family transcriptional regulator
MAECLDDAASWCDSLLQEAQQRDVPLWSSMFAGMRSMICFRQGELAAAERHAYSALSLVSPKGLGVFIGIPLSVLILTAIQTADNERARSHVNMPVPDAMLETPVGLQFLRARGRYHLALRNYQAAIEDFQACGDLMRTWGLDLPGIVPWRTDLAEAQLAVGGSTVDLATEQLSRLGAHNDRTRGISLRVLAASTEDRHRPALLNEAVKLLQTSGAKLELATALAELSNTQRAGGDHPQARLTAHHAHQLISTAIPHQAAEPGQPVPMPAPARLPRTVAAAIAELSDAELRVATLAAQGYTNQRISRKLYVTVSTVEQHLTRVYRKLQITNRSDLPATLLLSSAGTA